MVLLSSWLPGRAAGQGVATDEVSICPAQVGDVVFPDRPGRDRLLLPAGYQELAPVTATWCRFGANGEPVAAYRLDAARTSQLAALLVAPPGGWPEDALAAKQIVPLTDAQLAAARAPECATPSAADLLVFVYGEGPDAAVLVHGEQCGTTANGVLRLRTPPGVGPALAGLSAE